MAIVPPKRPDTHWEDQWPAYDGYKALDSSRREIRLLEMHICQNSQALRTSLRHVSLDDNPDYCALSYCWGAPVRRKDHLPLWLDDSIVFVRPTLAHFLYNLARLVGPATVWLDALCINQRDLSEKKQQVAMMGRIYAMARKTYAWLGQGSAESDYVFQSLNNESVHPVTEADYEVYIRQILQQLYWKRAWIVQEYALSREVILLMGSYMVGADEFLRNIPVNMVKDAQVSKLNSTKAQVHGRLHSLGSIDSFTELVVKFRDFGCSDVRDKFYSLLSLVDTPFEPDYGLPAFDLIFRMTHTLSSSCKVLSDNPSRRISFHETIRYLQAMVTCTRPGIRDLLTALRLPSPPFAISMVFTGRVAEVRPYTDKTSSRWEILPRAWYTHKDIMARTKGAYLFQVSQYGPLTSLYVAVTKSCEVAVVIKQDLDFWSQFISLRDLCVLSAIVSQSLKPCRRKELHRDQVEQRLRPQRDYHCFHINRTILVLLSLTFPGIQPSVESQVCREFLAHVRRNGLDSRSVSSDCDATEGATCRNLSTFDSDGQASWDSDLWQKYSVFGKEDGVFDEPSWTVKNLFPDLEYQSPMLEDPEQDLPSDDYVKCDVWME